MNRRSFLASVVATASGLLLPEPRKVYSFARELRVPGLGEPRIKVYGPIGLSKSGDFKLLQTSWDALVQPIVTAYSAAFMDDDGDGFPTMQYSGAPLLLWLRVD
jgi:hypothetical protein